MSEMWCMILKTAARRGNPWHPERTLALQSWHLHSRLNCLIFTHMNLIFTILKKEYKEVGMVLHI